VNCQNVKNILGTFTPPHKIFIYNKFLTTLSKAELCSGVGEMLKVHAIAGKAEFAKVARDYSKIFSESDCMQHYIRHSLELKKVIIEQDEFDRNIRNVMNYGHTFGHAIESATEYRIPHGIAVTIGMDMANFVAFHLNISTEAHYYAMQEILQKNYADFINEPIHLETFFSAIAKDKKNKGKNQLGLILPNMDGIPTQIHIDNDGNFQKICIDYLAKGRNLKMKGKNYEKTPEDCRY